MSLRSRYRTWRARRKAEAVWLALVYATDRGPAPGP